MLFFVGESYDPAVRGTGTSFVTGVGPIGAVLASAGATALLGDGAHWQVAALLFGAIPCTLSGLLVLAARNIRPSRGERGDLGVDDNSPALESGRLG